MECDSSKDLVQCHMGIFSKEPSTTRKTTPFGTHSSCCKPHKFTRVPETLQILKISSISKYKSLIISFEQCNYKACECYEELRSFDLNWPRFYDCWGYNLEDEALNIPYIYKMRKRSTLGWRHAQLKWKILVPDLHYLLKRREI